MTAPTTALEAAMACGRALAARGIPYAIGGALAYGVWGVPRNTNDVDLNVFVEDDALDGVLAALEEAGVALDRARARGEAERQGMFIGHLGPFRIDVFTPSIEFSHEAATTRQRIPIGDEAFDFLSAEAITLFKLLFFRGKDRVDVERLVAAQPELDRDYVRTRLASWFAPDDARLRFWDALVAQFPA